MDTQSWYNAMVRPWSPVFWEDGVSTWYNKLAMNHKAPSKCAQIFALFRVNISPRSVYWSLAMARKTLPVSLCIPRMLPIEL